MEKFTVKRYGLRGKGYGFRENSLIKNMKAVHMLAAIAWGGGAFSMQALGFLRRSLNNQDLAAHVAYCSHFIDMWVVVPGLFGCVLTGLFYSLCTAIGFFKFAWIGYKWLIACMAGFWGVLFLGPWGNDLIILLRPYGVAWILEFARACILPENIFAALLQTFIIMSVCLISVYRPISMRFWLVGSGKRDLRRRINAVHAQDRELAMRSPQDNQQVQALYANWLGQPLGELSRKHLHMSLSDKSERLKKLAKAGMYPPGPGSVSKNS